MDLDGDGVRRFTTIVVCVAISIPAVILRFWCKYTLQRRMQADDWAILITTVSFCVLTAVDLWGIFGGAGGAEIPEVVAALHSSPSPETLMALDRYLTSLYIGAALIFWTLFLNKIAICLLYRQIFQTPRIRALSNVAMAVVTVHFIIIETINLAHCIPLSKYWDRTRPGHCLNFNLIMLLGGIFDAILDVAIICLPIWAVSKIQMPLKTRLIVAGIFLLGGFAIITNILRIYYTYQPNSEFVSITNAEFWSCIHITTTVLCACLPVYKPVRAKLGMLYSRIWDCFRQCGCIARGKARERISDSPNHLGPRGQAGEFSDDSDKRLGAQWTGSTQKSEAELIIRPRDGINMVDIRGNRDVGDTANIPAQGIGYSRVVEVSR